MTTTEIPDVPIPAGATAEDWSTTDGECLRSLEWSHHDAGGVNITVDGWQYTDGQVSSAVAIYENDAIRLTANEARVVAAALVEAAAALEDLGPMPTQPRVPPIECATWCANGDGHPNEFHAEDQTCRGEYATTVLSLVDQSEPGDITSYSKRYNGGQEHVCLNVMIENVDMDVPMTAAEARDVGHALIEAAYEIDPPRNQTTD